MKLTMTKISIKSLTKKNNLWDITHKTSTDETEGTRG
jgi:hypothetical protein